VTTLIILAFNEENHIKGVLDDYIEYFENIIVVDDKSSDKTLDLLNKYSLEHKKINIICNDKNYGAGRSLEIAIDAFLDGQDEYLVKIDGDNQFKKENILKIKEIIESKKYDYIKCDRFWAEGIEGNIPHIRYFGNAFASFLSKFTTGNWKINDPLNGLFALSKKSVSSLKLPKLFYRYGYPFYFVAYMTTLSLEKNIKIGQYKNTVVYKDEKSYLNPLTMFSKLMLFSVKNYYKKIKRKLRYSNLQISALLDVVSQIFLLLSIFSVYKFLMIRYFNAVGPQGSWFIVFIILFSLFSIFLFFSQRSENDQLQKNFSELN
jgi:dolichol-phosphate mannosyltransferase